MSRVHESEARMGLPVIAVVVPTIPGREKDYERCRDSYVKAAAGSYILEWCEGFGEPTCGWGWVKGTQQITHADFVHFTCDDIEARPRWADGAMIAITKERTLPSPRVYNGVTDAPEYFPEWGTEHPDGTEAGFSCLPFVTRWLWDNHVQPLLTCHYSTDLWITLRAQLAGYVPRVVHGYDFTHHWSDVDRGAGYDYEDRLRRDQDTFHEAVGMWQRGQWVSEWPPKGDPRCRKAGTL